MKIKNVAIAIALSSALISPLAMAEKAHDRQSFSADVTRTTGNGKTMSRHTEQVATANGFRRESTITNGAGKTANRVVEGSRDPETNTYTKTVQGTRMNGDSYSAERVTQRTDDGYVRTQTRTNAAGETASKQVTASVDHDTNTVTKNISATGFNGETHSATVVKTYSKGGAE